MNDEHPPEAIYDEAERVLKPYIDLIPMQCDSHGRRDVLETADGDEVCGHCHGDGFSGELGVVAVDTVAIEVVGAIWKAIRRAADPRPAPGATDDERRDRMRARVRGEDLRAAAGVKCETCGGTGRAPLNIVAGGERTVPRLPCSCAAGKEVYWTQRCETISKERFHEHLARMKAELALEQAEARVAELTALVRTMWIHSGYPDCGRDQMTTPQKALYDSIAHPAEQPAPRGECRTCGGKGTRIIIGSYSAESCPDCAKVGGGGVGSKP